MSEINVEEKMRTIRVLMVLPNLRVSNGVTNFAMNFFRGVDHQVIQIDFATLSHRDSPYLKEVMDNGAKVIVLPSIIRHPIKHIKKCKEIINTGNYSVIHVNTLNQAIPILLSAKNHVKVRILHSHSTKLGETRLKERINRVFLPALKKLTNFYAACSSNAGKALFGEKKFTVIPNVIDTNNFKYSEEKSIKIREREKVSGLKVVGSVGRLAEPKNPYFALEVAKRMFAQRNDIVYWWIGSGPLDASIKQYIEKANLMDKIKLFGSRDDITELFQAMDAFFLPSLFEGFGLACLEAQAAGLPCIVSCAFPSEVNITGNVQFISLDQTVDTWTEAVISSLDKKVDKGAANRICDESGYSIRNSGQLLTNYFYDCLNMER